MRAAAKLGHCAIVALIVGACGPQSQTNVAADNRVTEIETLPPDESSATDIVNGTDVSVDVNETGPRGSPYETRVIPAAFHGRWGTMAADCSAAGPGANRLMTIRASEVRYRGTVARPAILTLVGSRRIDGNFAGTTSGQTQTLLLRLELSSDGRTLTRSVDEGDSAPSPEGTRFTYRRCS